MRTSVRTIIGISSTAFLFWATVAPSGADLCSSSKEFFYHPLNESGHQAGIHAKYELCKLVKANPA